MLGVKQWCDHCLMRPYPYISHHRFGEWNRCKFPLSRLLELYLTENHISQMQTINSSFLPVNTLAKSSDDVVRTKRIDYAVFLNHKSEDPDVKALYAQYHAFQKSIQEGSGGVWNQSFTKTLIPFLFIKVNPKDPKEAEVQLMTVIGASQKCLLHMLDETAT